MRLRIGIRPTKVNDKGEQIVMLGLRIGYWPCMKAPFIEVVVWKSILDLWYGLPSSKVL